MENFCRQFFYFTPQKKIEFLFIVKIVKQQSFTYICDFSNFADRTFFIAVMSKDAVTGINNPLLFFKRKVEKFLVYKITSVNRFG